MERIVDSHALLRNGTGGSCLPFTPFLPVAPSCIIIAQFHNRGVSLRVCARVFALCLNFCAFSSHVQICAITSQASELSRHCKALSCYPPQPHLPLLLPASLTSAVTNLFWTLLSFHKCSLNGFLHYIIFSGCLRLTQHGSWRFIEGIAWTDSAFLFIDE